MSTYDKAIGIALTYAPDILEGERPPQSLDYAQYRDMPDDYMLPAQHPENMPGRVVVDTPEELAVLMDEFWKFIDLPYDDKGREYRASSLEHEQDHARASRRMGAEVVKFGVQALRVTKMSGGWGETFAPFTIAPGWHTTKLNHALSLVHPVTPSKEDLRVALEDLGYGTVATLAALATKHGRPIPRGATLIG